MSEKLRLEQEDLDIEKTQVPKVVEFPDTTIPTHPLGNDVRVEGRVHEQS